MATTQRQRTRTPARRDASGHPQRRPKNARAAAGRSEQDYRPSQYDFDAPADRAAEYWRAVIVLALVGIAVVGAIGAIAYFVGILAAGIAAAAVMALIAFGNWVLNNTIDLR